jgi:hypothetical protein
MSRRRDDWTAALPRADPNASRRALSQRAATVGLLMRNIVNPVVALIALAQPGSRCCA